MSRRCCCLGLVAVMILLSSATARADGAPSPPAPQASKSQPPAEPVPLNKQQTVLLDKPNKRLLLQTKVVLREGALEMLLCKKQTKEHESILAIDAQAYIIHTGLLALGAQPGTPVRYDIDEKKLYPPTGTEIDIFATWTDAKDQIHRVSAKQWIRRAVNRYYVATLDKLPAGLELPKDSELRYDEKLHELYWYGPMTAAQRDHLLKLSDDKTYQAAIRKFYQQSQSRPMAAKWVFAGSGFYVPEEGPDQGKRFYEAEGGDVICVANFPSAMIDVNEESSASGSESLLYEAWTEKIPPVDTPVTLELIPVLDKKSK